MMRRMARFDPFAEMRDLSPVPKSFNDMFDILRRNEINVSSFIPDVNTREGDYAFHIDVDLPGMRKEDISIHIDDNILTVSGERKTKEEVKKEDYYKIESQFGQFERRFTLPADIDRENIHAETSDGVLEITIPKLAAKKEEVKKIDIK